MEMETKRTLGNFQGPNLIQVPVSEVESIQSPCIAMNLNGSIEHLIKVVQRKCTKSESKSVIEELRRQQRKLGLVPQNLEEIMSYCVVQSASSMSLPNSRFWTFIKNIYCFLRICRKNPSYIQCKESASAIALEGITQNERDENKFKRICKLEKTLKDYEEMIEEWDKKDVDWEDEGNSPYLVKTRLITKYFEIYKNLCILTGCNMLTGRPTDKKIKLSHVTNYAELNTAAETFLNSKKPHFMPDYLDIFNLTETVNLQNKLCLSPDDVRKTALELFQNIVKIVKERRGSEFKIAIRVDEEELEDPADKDPDLQRKLNANKALSRSEHEILSDFATKQRTRNLEAEDVIDEDPDGSIIESSDEEPDSETDMAEGLFVVTEHKRRNSCNWKEKNSDHTEASDLTKKKTGMAIRANKKESDETADLYPELRCKLNSNKSMDRTKHKEHQMDGFEAKETVDEDVSIMVDEEEHDSKNNGVEAQVVMNEYEETYSNNRMTNDLGSSEAEKRMEKKVGLSSAKETTRAQCSHAETLQSTQIKNSEFSSEGTFSRLLRKRKIETAKSGEYPRRNISIEVDCKKRKNSRESSAQKTRKRSCKSEYIVEEIVDKKIVGGKWKYHIKWLGWPSESNTWETLPNLAGCLDMVQAFEMKLQRKNKYKTSNSSN